MTPTWLVECTRHREPSRICKAKLCRVRQKRSKRKCMNFLPRHFIPHSSEMYSFRKVQIYKLWLLKYSGNHFYGRYYFKKWERQKSTREASCVPSRKFSSLQRLNGGMNFNETLVQTNLNHQNNPHNHLMLVAVVIAFFKPFLTSITELLNITM